MKSELKLMIVTPYFYLKVGGLENYVYGITNGLEEILLENFVNNF